MPTIDYQQAIKAGGDPQSLAVYAQKNGVQITNAPKDFGVSSQANNQVKVPNQKTTQQPGQQAGQTKQPNNPLSNIVRRVGGAAANLLPMVGNIVGSNVGAAAGTAGGAAAGAAVPGLGETGISEVAGGIEGEIAGRAGGGAIGQSLGELGREFIRQKLLGLDEPNPVQNTKLLAQAAEEGALYGLIPMGGSASGLMGFAKRAIVGGGISGAAQAVDNVNKGKEFTDHVGWSSFLGGMFNGLIGGRLDGAGETIQMDGVKEPVDFYTAAKTSPEEFTKTIVDYKNNALKAVSPSVKIMERMANENETKLGTLLAGKVVDDGESVVSNLNQISEDNNFAFKSAASTSKRADGTIERVKNLLLDSAKEGEKISSRPDISSSNVPQESPTSVGTGENLSGGKFVRTGSGFEKVSQKISQGTEEAAKTSSIPRSSFKTLDELTNKTPVSLAKINEAKRIVGDNYDRDPVFQKMYTYLQKLVENESGVPDKVRETNQFFEALRTTKSTMKDTATKLADANIKEATDRLIAGDRSGVDGMQKAIKAMSMGGGLAIGSAIGHPFLGMKISGILNGPIESVSSGVADTITKLNSNEYLKLNQLLQNGGMRAMLGVSNAGDNQGQ
jgi:hypothetical protein